MAPHTLSAVSHRNVPYVAHLHQPVHQPSLKPTANDQQQPHTRDECIRFIHAEALHQLHAPTNLHEQVLPALAARRSGVRSPSAPLQKNANLQANHEHEEGVGSNTGPFDSYPVILGHLPSSPQPDFPSRAGRVNRYRVSWLWWRAPEVLGRAWDVHSDPVTAWTTMPMIVESYLR